MKCHYVTEPDGQRYLIPGCVPGWYDSETCTCRWRDPPKRPTEEQKLIKELEHENARLNRLLFRVLQSRPPRGKAR